MVPEGEEYAALARVLLEARASAKVTLRELAADLGWHHSVIGKVETCSRSLDVIEFIRVARALGIEPGKLLQKVVKAADL